MPYKTKIPIFFRADRESRSAGACYPGIDIGHIAPDWDRLMVIGVPGIIADLRHAKEKDPDNEYYDSCLRVYEAFRRLILRFADEADTYHTEKTDFTAKNLRAIADAAPKTLAEGMQLTFLFYRTTNIAETTIIRSLGNIDRLYAPLYRADLSGNEFSESNLRELTRDFLWKISAMKTGANLPLMIGGIDENGRDACNEYTTVLLEEYRSLGIYDPKIHVLWHEGMKEDVFRTILAMIREGKNSFVFINTPLAAKALEKIGISSEDAKRVAVYGCYETAAAGTELPATCGGSVNMVKAIELALNDGTDPASKRQVGPHTGLSFSSFEDFFAAVKAQLCCYTKRCMDIITAYEGGYRKHLASPMLSATYVDSVKKGIDLFAGGAKYNNTSIVGCGIATLVDSVLAVKRLCFEQAVSFDDLRAMLSADWNGYEAVRTARLNDTEKYGNHIKEADQIAEDLFCAFERTINGQPNGRGGVFRCGLFSVDWRFFMGEATGATPDGRRAKEPISKNTAAVIGQDRQGVTALLQSMLTIDGSATPDGNVADVVLHCSAVSGDDGFEAFVTLVKTYLQMGGFSVHLNVLNPEELRRAQKNPAEYQNLQIRLCGWNVRFVDLSREEQDEFILQSTNGNA